MKKITPIISTLFFLAITAYAASAQTHTVCADADFVIPVNMWVMGENCHTTERTSDDFIFQLATGGRADIVGVVERNTPGQFQPNEAFTFWFNDGGPVSVPDYPDPHYESDNPELVQLGNYQLNTIDSNWNAARMETLAACPRDGHKPNSVELTSLCFYRTCTDADNDGFNAEGGSCGAVDCNDNNRNVNPGAAESCNTVDDNCNSQTDEGDVCSVSCGAQETTDLFASWNDWEGTPTLFREDESNVCCNQNSHCAFEGSCVPLGFTNTNHPVEPNAAVCARAGSNNAAAYDCRSQNFGDIFPGNTGSQQLCCTDDGDGDDHGRFTTDLSACAAAPVCGNGVREAGEQCDQGAANGNSCSAPYGGSCSYCSNHCTTVFSIGGRCGDGVRQSLYEQCDDANLNNGDGCSATCTLENADVTLIKRAAPAADGQPLVTEAGPVKFVYRVTNTGDVSVTDVAVNDDKIGFVGGIGTLNPSESIKFIKWVTINENHTNIGTVTGDSVVGSVTDSDDAEVVITPTPECQTNADCSDGLFCNGQEVCDQITHTCQPGTVVDCSANNVAGISTCANDPDNNPFTLDESNGFTSQCNEATDSCTQPNDNDLALTHTCSQLVCGAECDANTDCTAGLNGVCTASCACEYDAPPTELDVTLTANPITGNEPLSVSFTCSVENGDIPLTYSFDRGDGSVLEVISTTSDSLTFNNTYTQGDYTATCSVADNDGRTDVDSVTISVSQQPATCGNGQLDPGEECELGFTQVTQCGTTDVGVCEFGTQHRTCQSNCQWSAFTQCQGNVDPTPETCDNADNDCDGSVDENNVCAAPTTPVTESIDDDDGRLILSRVGVIEEVIVHDEDLVVVVNVLNKETTNLDNLKISLVVPELGIKKSARVFDLDEDDETTRVLAVELPAYAPAGEYDVRITVSNDNFRRVKHRLFWLN